jgi:type II secretory pathway pseudopilin PulG
MTTKQNNRQRQAGFTLIELSMSLIFIAFIMLFLTSTMLNIMQIYNKGIWLNQINQAGRQINSDIGDQVRFSKNEVTIKSDEQRLCIGGVTYLWNTSKSVKNWYFGETAENTKLRFARVLDETGAYCDDTSVMPSRNDSKTTALLGPGAIVQQFNVTEGIETGLIRVQAVFSTEGDDQPRLVNPDTNQLDTGDPPAATSSWRCGELIGDEFKVGNNKFCAFAEFDIITYRRMK